MLTNYISTVTTALLKWWPILHITSRICPNTLIPHCELRGSCFRPHSRGILYSSLCNKFSSSFQIDATMRLLRSALVLLALTCTTAPADAGRLRTSLCPAPIDYASDDGDKPSFCRGLDCPDFEVTNTTKYYEERVYEEGESACIYASVDIFARHSMHAINAL